MKLRHSHKVSDFHRLSRLKCGGTDSERLVLAVSVGLLWPSQVQHLVNKSTAVYILPSAQYANRAGLPLFIPGHIFSATFQEWILCYDTDLAVDCEHFIASLPSITTKQSYSSIFIWSIAIFALDCDPMSPQTRFCVRPHRQRFADIHVGSDKPLDERDPDHVSALRHKKFLKL